MPDLTIEIAFTCASNVDEYRHNIKSLTNRCWYTVRYGKLHGEQLLKQGCEYGWTCDCKGFKFRGTCKHIQAEKSNRCGWNAELDPGLQPAADSGLGDEYLCPVCRGPARAVRVGV